MNGLTEKDLQILEHYAAEGNRVLYFNYLAALEGADKYPAMALGVVNNDSLAGQIANRPSLPAGWRAITGAAGAGWRTTTTAGA